MQPFARMSGDESCCFTLAQLALCSIASQLRHLNCGRRTCYIPVMLERMLSSPRLEESDMYKVRLTLALVLLGIGIAGATTDQPGVWSKAGAFAQVVAGCTQVWSCGPVQDQLIGEDDRIVTTENKITFGTCSVGDGPIGSCNACLASAPSQPCNWHVEKK